MKSFIQNNQQMENIQALSEEVQLFNIHKKQYKDAGKKAFYLSFGKNDKRNSFRSIMNSILINLQSNCLV